MDSPFQLSECRTTSPPDQSLEDNRSGLFASPSPPTFYRCSSSFTPTANLQPWSPFRTPLDFYPSSAFVTQSISPIIRSNDSYPDPSSSTPFVQKLLNARPPPPPPSSPPTSTLSLSSDFDSPLSSPESTDHDEPTFQSIADKVKRSRRPLPKRKAQEQSDTRPTKLFRRQKQTHIQRSVPIEDQGESADDIIVHNPSDYPSPPYPLRTFPPQLPLHSGFPLFYRRFPVSTYQSSACGKISGSSFNAPRNRFDLYTPRFVKGSGREKMGLCPICVEPVDRGGQGKKVFLSTKFSAFKCYPIKPLYVLTFPGSYHMQYSHGISVISAVPFSPPIAFRVKPRSNVAKHERDHIAEGQCHKCAKWIALETVKDTEVKVKEIFWWKHAASCHQGSTIPGERDIFLHDDLYVSLNSQDNDDDD